MATRPAATAARATASSSCCPDRGRAATRGIVAPCDPWPRRCVRCSSECRGSPPRRSRSARRPGACSPPTSSPRARCRASTTRRWTATPRAPRSCRRRCRSPASSPRASRAPARSRRGRRVRIFTGAPMPPELDTVVIQEDATRDGDRVTLPAAPAGDNVRRAGEDVAIGERGARRRDAAPAVGPRRARRARRRRGAGRARAARRADRHRRRAGRRRHRRPGPGSSSTRRCTRSRRWSREAGGRAERLGIARDDPAAIAADDRGRARSRRRDHDRRRLGRRPRPRARRARRRRRRARALEGRDEAGQAVLVRAARRRTTRCSACPATRCRRWSRSSCSCGRRCSRCRAPRSIERPRAPVRLAGRLSQAGRPRALPPRARRARRRPPDRAPAPEAGLGDAVVAGRRQRARRAGRRADRVAARRAPRRRSCWRPYEDHRRSPTTASTRRSRGTSPTRAAASSRELFDEGCVTIGGKRARKGDRVDGRRRDRAGARAGRRRGAPPGARSRRRPRGSTILARAPRAGRDREAGRHALAAAARRRARHGRQRDRRPLPGVRRARRRPARRRARPPARHRHVGRAGRRAHRRRRTARCATRSAAGSSTSSTSRSPTAARSRASATRRSSSAASAPWSITPTGSPRTPRSPSSARPADARARPLHRAAPAACTRSARTSRTSARRSPATSCTAAPRSPGSTGSSSTPRGSRCPSTAGRSSSRFPSRSGSRAPAPPAGSRSAGAREVARLEQAQHAPDLAAARPRSGCCSTRSPTERLPSSRSHSSTRPLTSNRSGPTRRVRDARSRTRPLLRDPRSMCSSDSAIAPAPRISNALKSSGNASRGFSRPAYQPNEPLFHVQTSMIFVRTWRVRWRNTSSGFSRPRPDERVAELAAVVRHHRERHRELAVAEHALA